MRINAPCSPFLMTTTDGPQEAIDSAACSGFGRPASFSASSSLPKKMSTLAKSSLSASGFESIQIVHRIASDEGRLDHLREDLGLQLGVDVREEDDGGLAVGDPALPTAVRGRHRRLPRAAPVGRGPLPRAARAPAGDCRRALWGRHGHSRREAWGRPAPCHPRLRPAAGCGDKARRHYQQHDRQQEVGQYERRCQFVQHRFAPQADLSEDAHNQAERQSGQVPAGAAGAAARPGRPGLCRP